MPRGLALLIGIVAGYLLGAFGGGWLLTATSANSHDRALEAAMTGAFVLGPVGALGGLVAAMWWHRTQSHRPTAGADEPRP